eukprot:13827420-Ditylum_brightwellii.AAC.1
MEDNTEDLYIQGKMVRNKGTEKELKKFQKVIEKLEIKAYSLQNIASKLKVDACHRASNLSHIKWDNLVIDQKQHCSDCSEETTKHVLH